MKKTALILLLTLILSSVTVAAAPGDVAGNIYYTDIKTYIYNAPVTTYNIGGLTVIDAEILNWHYGFDVYWYEESRQLEITDKGGRNVSGQALSGEICDSLNGKSGDVAGEYYETDIITLLNGKEIESYNIGGRTCIVAEKMSDFGYEVKWDKEERTLKIDKPLEFNKYETPLGTFKTRDNYESFINFACECEARIELIGDVSDFEGTHKMIEKPVHALTNQTTSMLISFDDFAEIFGGKWTLKEEMEERESSWGSSEEHKEVFEEYKYTLEFTYDDTKKVEVTEFIDTDAEGTHPNQSGRLDGVISFSDIEFKVNGEIRKIMAQWGGKEFETGFVMYNGKLYMPVHTVAKLMGYDLAVLDIIRY